MSKMSQKKILKQYLETVYDQQGKRKDSLYGIILERGRFFKPVPLPDGLELGEQGLCYRNSYLEYAGILPNLYRLMRHDDCNPFKAEAWAKKD